MTPLQKNALIRLATDLSRGDKNVIQQIEKAIKTPPKTSKEVGYYLGGDENDFEICFRKMASLLSDSKFTTSAEDKYIYEIFSQWEARLGDMPNSIKEALPFIFDESYDIDELDEEEIKKEAVGRMQTHLLNGLNDIAKKFEKKSMPLLTIDTGGGDTLLFINVTSEVATLWRNVEIGRTHDDIPLAIRSPYWESFCQHLEYALGIDDQLSSLQFSTKPLRSLDHVK